MEAQQRRDNLSTQQETRSSLGSLRWPPPVRSFLLPPAGQQQEASRPGPAARKLPPVLNWDDFARRLYH
jgi:hypothetical protein